jgi:hypothetical protein
MLKKPLVLVIVGVLAGYSLSRVLDNVPIVKAIPKIRI